MTRKRIDFWLFTEETNDKTVMRVIRSLKKKKLFRQTVMDGIMIVAQLRQGKTDLLFKKFPWIVDKILASAPVSTTDNTDIERQIADLRRIMLERGGELLPSPPADYPQMKSLSAGVGSTLGQGRKMTLPLVDDDDTLVLTKSAGTNSTQNFLASFAKLGL